jgi:hypothetical protein
MSTFRDFAYKILRNSLFFYEEFVEKLSYIYVCLYVNKHFPCHNLVKHGVFLLFFCKVLNYQFFNPSNVGRVIRCARTEGRTDGRTATKKPILILRKCV